VTVEPVAGDGSVEAYYKATMDKLGQSFQILTHVAWKGGYADLMTGTSSDVAFADAYLKGVRNFDVKAAYEAAVRNASVAPPSGGVGRKGLDTSIFLGYTPTTTDEGMVMFLAAPAVE